MWKEYHVTSKVGPAEKAHALTSALWDLASLRESQLQAIFYLGGRDLQYNMEILLESSHVLSKLFVQKVGETRKLVGIPDKEGKTRVIAVLDYWSQTALRPVHDLLMRILKTIPQDMTFDQGRFKEVALG